jgi:hypothetical protein
MKPFLNNFTEIQERFRAWWGRENRRPLIHAHIACPDRPVTPPDDLEDWYLDARRVFAKARAHVNQDRFPGVAEEFPNFAPHIPYGAFFGSTPVFQERTIWHSPLPEAEDPYASLAFRDDNPWWRRSVAMYSDLADLADGHFFPAIPSLYGPLDVLEALAGSSRLCLDLVDRPKSVRAAQDVILSAWRRQYDMFQGIVQRRFDGGVTGFLPLWCPGRGYSLQCDFSGMLSDRMFEEFVVPEIEAQAAWLDYSMYHLDGPAAAHHADRIIRIPRLNGIQWQKGVNGGSTISWIPLLQKIQQAGKLVEVDGSPDEIDELSRRLDPGGLFLATSFPTRADAEEMVRRFERRFGDG